MVDVDIQLRAGNGWGILALTASTCGCIFGLFPSHNTQERDTYIFLQLSISKDKNHN